MKQLSKIRTTGPLSVEEVDKIPNQGIYSILVVGQTGAGKSTFIESFSKDRPLGIAKDQLESVTQKVVAYKLINVERSLSGHNFVPMYIIDTPGFSDPKLSEMKIIKMILKFTQEQKLKSYSRILYFDRITDTRMSGSKGRNLDLFKVLTGEKSAKRITIITTMWDQIWYDDQREKAQKRFEQLSDGFWEDFVKQGAKLVKFENEQQSTLGLLDAWLSGYRGSKFEFEGMLESQDIQNTALGASVYEALVDRISNLRQRLQSIEQDLAQDDTKENPELLEHFKNSRADALSLLATFEQELLDFDPSSYPSRRNAGTSTELEVAPSIVRSSDLSVSKHNNSASMPEKFTSFSVPTEAVANGDVPNSPSSKPSLDSGGNAQPVTRKQTSDQPLHHSATDDCQPPPASAPASNDRISEQSPRTRDKRRLGQLISRMKAWFRNKIL